ncbi:unnamed protein product [Adineta ricciae]|uniref:Peptidase C14 caspase domain-containing protein n=1 Tax=Adineta ricciae TaxID=249248 RepID=A0A814TP00_ADIRI|nr:unnamed protein product [Adineta ricciae]CAF1164899.1 unnamed protein product [Adineta ricciae]
MHQLRALIIGNSDYTESPLPHCVSDAAAFSRALQEVTGCETHVSKNLKADMYGEVNKFLNSIQQNDFVVFYFSGYAARWRQQIVLLSCENNRIRSENFINITHYGIDAQALLDDMARKTTHFVLFLFDCYQVLLEPSVVATGTPSNRSADGSNTIQAPKNTIIGFVCASSKPSSGFMGNGLFTTRLLKHIKNPKFDVVSMLKEVHQDLIQETNNTQQVIILSSFKTQVLLPRKAVTSPALQASTEKQYNIPPANVPPNNKQNVPQPAVHNVAAKDKGTLTRNTNTIVSSPSESDSSGHVIERKAIGITGKLGQGYDALSDRVDDSLYHNKGDRSIHLVEYLSKIKFENILIQRLFFGTIYPSGISCLISYERPVNENTWFLYYSHTFGTQKSTLTSVNSVQTGTHPNKNFRGATHIITEIQYGIEVLCVIQVPKDRSCENIDILLRNISEQLKDKQGKVNLNADEQSRIRQLGNIRIYGAARYIFNRDVSLSYVLSSLPQWQTDPTYYHPLVYKMISLHYHSRDQKYIEISLINNDTNSVMERLLSSITDMHRLVGNTDKLLDTSLENVPNLTIKHQWICFRTEFNELSSAYRQLCKHFQQTLRKLGNNPSDTEEIDRILSNNEWLSLQNNFHKLQASIKKCLSKIEFIEMLKKDQIEYQEVSEIIKSTHRQSSFPELHTALQLYLKKSRQSLVLMYSSDQLRQQRADDWERMYKQFKLERQNRAEKYSLIYVDFTQYEHLLTNFDIIRPVEDKPPASSSKKPSTELNVLLIGETGVGKSTFINAFVNYLKFDNIHEAEQGEPAVVIPVSFPIATGDEFKEVTIQFGVADSNENHQNKGQSVTQHCRSYIINLNEEVKIRLIDSPGIGDTRGFNQDQISMDHIFTYINQLTHLNAVCLLLKPTVSKLDVFFRSCVRQLLTYLTPKGHPNIIFCFTNSRSTFYGPGSTGSALKRLLKEEGLQQTILFEKSNVFCFDDETFRYLAARKCKVDFDDFVRDEAILSWTKSVTESIQFVKFIRTLKPYKLDEHQSLRKVALDVAMLSRPLMELLRVMLYHWKLIKYGRREKTIIIQPSAVDIEICSNCADRIRTTIASFNIVQYKSTKSRAQATCHCPCNEKHFLIEYTVIHELKPQSLMYSSEQLKGSLEKLLFKYDRLTYFLQRNGFTNKNDLFSSIWEQFLDGENHIYEELQSLTVRRDKNNKELVRCNENLTLDDAVELAHELKSENGIDRQIECIKTSRRLLMEKTVSHINTPISNNNVFATLTSFQP